MGHGSYQASDWARLKNSRGINDTSNVGEIFQQKELQDKFNPKLISYRESRDSADSPESTPIIIGFDVTGSMGYLAAEIAKNSLNKTVMAIYDKQPVSNPHILCAPFTGPSTPAPLQVTQFEADIRIVEQLLDMWVGFGGNRYSFDSFAWYFAANHTKIDSFEKRGKKGFLFCIGDEICGRDEDVLEIETVKKIFDDDITKGLTLSEVRKMVSEKYEIFHIVTQMRGNCAFETWDSFMPGRVANIGAESVEYLSEVIISIMMIANGMDRKAVISQWPAEAQRVVSSAITGISPEIYLKAEKEGFFDKLYSKFKK